MEPSIKIKRESEFYKGCIRFKVTVANESDYVITDVTLDFKIDKTILHVVKHDNCSARNGQLQFVLGNIKRHNSKTFTVLFEPLTCTESTDIRCLVTYADHEENMNSTFMEPKKISVICPIMETEQDINIGRLKEFIETLPVKDSRIYEIQSGFDLNRLKTTSREVVEKHHVRHISTLHRLDGNICEMWYYGRTKVKEYDSVIKVSIFTEDKTVELFAATKTIEGLTGLLAEFGREIKDAVELGISGRGNVSLIVRNSKIDRSNLVDLCNMDGTCDKTIIIENTSITRTGIGSSNDREIDLPRSNIAGVNGNRECPVCCNVIDSSNKSLLCKCGIRFCQTCESWFREETSKPGERPLCEACFTEQQGLLAREMEETARLKAVEEAEKKRKAEEEKLKKEREEQERLRRQREEEERKRRDKEELEQRKAQEAARLKAVEEAERKRKEEERLRREREEAAKKPAASIKNSIGIEFVLIPSGEFIMGSNDCEDEKPVHKVKISKPFYFGKYPITQKEWVTVMGSNSNPSRFKGDNNPVEQVSWNDVQEFVKKLNAKEGTNKYRLPSEAEWEYACRAGTTTKYSFGDDESKLGEYAWYYENSKDGLLFAKNKTHSVGQKKPNPWGLYDMHGNVFERCQDSSHDNYQDVPTDGSAWEDGSSYTRVTRGGSWFYDAWDCRSTNRFHDSPVNFISNFGFRLLREV